MTQDIRDKDIVFEVRENPFLLVFLYFMLSGILFVIFGIITDNTTFSLIACQVIILPLFYHLLFNKHFIRFYDLTFTANQLEVKYVVGGKKTVPFEHITQITYSDIEHGAFTKGQKHFRNITFFFDDTRVLRELSLDGEPESSLQEVKRVMDYWKEKGYDIETKTVDYYNSKKWVLPKVPPPAVSGNKRLYRRFVTKYD